MAKSIVARIVTLQRMSFEELRTAWREVLKSAPPVSLNRGQLIARIAYRIQEEAFGELPPQARARMEQIAGSPSTNATTRSPDRLSAGTRLVREWQGERKEVTVLSAGFEYAGKRYRSLSAIATEITGTKWNGPDFFGLRRRNTSACSLK